MPDYNIDNFEKKAWGYALKNAIEHKGTINPGSVLSGMFHEYPKEFVLKNKPLINKIISQANELKLPEQKNKFEKLKSTISKRTKREGLRELPNVSKKGVVMRIAPSPSGAFHIGHALTASLSYLYMKKYSGKFYVRIEDTNTDNIYPPAYKLLKKDSDWLFNKEEKFVIQSNRMSIYYSYAEKLIKKNAAYVCTCSHDEFEKFVKTMTDCPCRTLDSKENIARWKKMLSKTKGNFKQGSAVLRFKSLNGMSDKNPAFRDFPLARINETPHPLQKKKYRVWPLMNLAVSVDDIEMKMTHIIRAKEHRDNAKRQEMIFKILGKKLPWTGFLGRIHLKDFKLSATQITKDITEGKYSGWDDPKLPTLASLKKQGYKPKAFWKFAEHIGLSENDKVMDRKEFFLLLDSFNKG